MRIRKCLALAELKAVQAEFECVIQNVMFKYS